MGQWGKGWLFVTVYLSKEITDISKEGFIMKLKKVLSVAMAMTMIAAMAGCGNESAT